MVLVHERLNLCLQAATQITAMLKVTIQFELFGKKLMCKVFVIKGLHEPYILGKDCIREKGLSYCPVHREFFCEGAYQHERMKIKVYN